MINTKKQTIELLTLEDKDIVLDESGDYGIVVGDIILYEDTYMPLSEYDDRLRHAEDDFYNIVKVFKTDSWGWGANILKEIRKPSRGGFEVDLELIWERGE